MTRLRYNPFRPSALVPIGLFVGRTEESTSLGNMLFNTTFGNPQHFLLHGERGIGKSSLMYVQEMVASGVIAPLGSQRRFNFLVVQLNLDNTDTAETVILKLGRGLRDTFAAVQKGQEFLKSAWKFISRFEAAGIKLRDAADTDSDVPIMEMVQAYTNACADIKGFYDGILLLIDEADRAPASAHLGSTLKVLTERVARTTTNFLCVGLAGVSSLMSILRESHESSPRLFRTIELKPLSDVETREVIRRGLSDAEEKNGFAVTMDDDAEGMLVDLSEGYPNFIQEFAFHAFAIDDDNRITVFDVLEGAYSEHGAFAQLGSKYFRHLYLGKIASEKYRQLLQAMAGHGDSWITKAEIRKEAGLSETILSNGLQALSSRKIIIANEGLRGSYRLPSRSFAAWIEAYGRLQQQQQSPADLWELAEEGVSMDAAQESEYERETDQADPSAESA